MNFSSPFFIVPLIAIIFFTAIFFATSTKEDGAEKH